MVGTPALKSLSLTTATAATATVEPPPTKVTGEEPWGKRLWGTDAGDFASTTVHRAKIAEFIANEAAAVKAAGLTQKPGTESFAKFHEGSAPKGVAVLLHGLSVSPDQMRYLVDDLYAKGYDVFVPKLPGHGLLNKEGLEDTSLVPTANTSGQWKAFAEQVYGAVSSAGKVTPIGLSCGGMLALQMAENHAQDKNTQGERVIQQVITISPFLGFAGVGAQIQSSIAGALAGWFPNAMTKLLSSQKVFVEGKNPQKIADGFREVNKAQALGMNLAAQEVLAGADKLKGIPVLTFISKADDQADAPTSEKFAADVGATSVVFAKEDGVPHAMNNANENPDSKSVALVNREILARM